MRTNIEKYGAVLYSSTDLNSYNFLNVTLMIFFLVSFLFIDLAWVFCVIYPILYPLIYCSPILYLQKRYMSNSSTRYLTDNE